MIRRPAVRVLSTLALAATTALGLGLGTATTAAAQPTNLKVGQTATFAHLTVKVVKTDRKTDPHFFGAKVKVCVTSLPKGSTSMRLSWDPWTVNTGIEPGGFEIGESPWYGHEAPVAKKYHAGQCMTGWLPFAVSARKKVTSIRYANSLGNHAVFAVKNGTTPQRKLGSTAHFDNFTVKVSKTKLVESGLYAYVTTCVTKLPKGSAHGKTRVSWDPWVSTAGTHFAFVPYVFDASHTSTPMYPQSKLLKVGQCVKGWIPFEHDVLASDLKPDGLVYRNFLGDRAFWATH